MGYWRAGFDVVGVDINPQPNYPFDFVQADALTFPLDGFDAYHASPPCQLFSRISECRPGLAERHTGMIAPTRTRLERTGKPYVIENVGGAPVRPDLLLCGAMFGYRLYRHRLFESNVPMPEPEHPAHQGAGTPVYGHSLVRASRQAMAISWTTRDELAQAIPPYFTLYIGGFLLQAVEGKIPLSTRAFRDDMADMTAPVDIPLPMTIPDPATLALFPKKVGRVYRWEDMRPANRPGAPRGALPATEAAVLFAVLHQDRPTVRTVAEATQLSISHAHMRLCELRVKGLVTWEEGKAGTIRPNVGFLVARSEQRQ
jgi:DNA (cytosine-5)-methyltransferase 1